MNFNTSVDYTLKKNVFKIFLFFFSLIWFSVLFFLCGFLFTKKIKLSINIINIINFFNILEIIFFHFIFNFKINDFFKIKEEYQQIIKIFFLILVFFCVFMFGFMCLTTLYRIIKNVRRLIKLMSFVFFLIILIPFFVWIILKLLMQKINLTKIITVVNTFLVFYFVLRFIRIALFSLLGLRGILSYNFIYLLESFLDFFIFSVCFNIDFFFIHRDFFYKKRVYSCLYFAFIGYIFFVKIFIFFTLNLIL